MEKALRYELESRIPELVGNIYPTNAPETATRPYLVYARISTKQSKTLEGYTNKQALSYMFSCMAVKYGDMKSLTTKIEEFLKSIPRTTIGEENIYIEDMELNNISETWEPELGVNRGIIDFTIHF
jgi:hypothetical protein